MKTVKTPNSPRQIVLTESTNRTSADVTPQGITPNSTIGAMRLETLESAFDEHIHQPLDTFNADRILDKLIDDMNLLGEI